MPLTEATRREVEDLQAKAEELAAAGQHEAALVKFHAALCLLPEPREACDEAWSLLAAIGDTHFLLKRYSEAADALMKLMSSFDEGPGNPFLRLRLGQALYELGSQEEAASWLAGAYLMEGVKLFAHDDPKYLTFIKPQLQPPPGGWPEGW